jgi:hypothetical protein
LSSSHLEALPATTFRACSSPEPMLVKPQPAPTILSKESVHTMLSITHHTRKRPSTGPRTTHGPQQLSCVFKKKKDSIRSIFICISFRLCYKNLSLFTTSSLSVLTKISYPSQEIVRQAMEITVEMCGELCHWLERALLRLGVPPTYVTYRAEYVPTVMASWCLPQLPSFLTRCFPASMGRSATALP